MKQKLGKITREHSILKAGIRVLNEKFLKDQEKLRRVDEVQRSKDHLQDNYNRLQATYQKQQQELTQLKMQNAYLYS